MISIKFTTQNKIKKISKKNSKSFGNHTCIPNANYSHFALGYSSLPRYVTTEEEYTNCGRKSTESAENSLIQIDEALVCFIFIFVINVGKCGSLVSKVGERN